MKKKLLIFLIVALICLTSCKINQRKEMVEHLYNSYTNKGNLNEFCGANDDYEMIIKIEEMRIQVSLEKVHDNNWSGKLSLHEESSLIEEIPVTVIGEEMLIGSNDEKVSTDNLFFTQFDPQKCTITETIPDVLGVPNIDEIIGGYPIDDIKPYMQKLYDEVLSNLKSFDRKGDYLSAINQLDSFVFNRYNADPEKDLHKLSFGFTGNEKVKWNPGVGNLGEISMLFSEVTPVSW